MHLGPGLQAPVLDACAAPGGKAIALAAAADVRPFIAAELERGLPDLCRYTRGTDVELDAETRERLRRMGYLD